MIASRAVAYGILIAVWIAIAVFLAMVLAAHAAAADIQTAELYYSGVGLCGGQPWIAAWQNGTPVASWTGEVVTIRRIWRIRLAFGGARGAYGDVWATVTRGAGWTPQLAAVGWHAYDMPSGTEWEKERTFAPHGAPVAPGEVLYFRSSCATGQLGAFWVSVDYE